MRLTVPITGTVLVEGSVHGEGKLTGDPNDPIRPISIDLGNVNWKMVDVDLDNEVMVIEVKACDIVSEPTGGIDADGNPTYTQRPATEEEKVAFLQHAQDLVLCYSKDELYQISGSARLKIL